MGTKSASTMGLDELRKSLLYNKVVDVWEAVCNERGWRFFDTQAFSTFLHFLRNEGLNIQKLPVCANEQGEREELSKRSSIFFGDPMKTFVVKTDPKSVEKLRSFKTA